jgi:hypothetical protein
MIVVAIGGLIHQGEQKKMFFRAYRYSGKGNFVA